MVKEIMAPLTLRLPPHPAREEEKVIKKRSQIGLRV